MSTAFAIAMANAADAVKRAAQAVTLPNDEDGLAAAIDRYVLDG
jgi:hydroxymethylpyrimidine pyrophosphatase-like HAD family hydrolase